MPAKDLETRRATNRACYHRRKHLLTAEKLAHKTATKRARQHSIHAWFKELKSRLACNRCGESHPACLQFHHKNPAEKERDLSAAIRRAWGRARIMRELEKCEVLCANCHIRHHVKYGPHKTQPAVHA